LLELCPLENFAILRFFDRIHTQVQPNYIRFERKPKEGDLPPVFFGASTWREKVSISFRPWPAEEIIALSKLQLVYFLQTWR